MASTVEGKLLHTTSSTTNRGKVNILEKKQENKITDSKQKNLEYNDHVSDRNDNTKENIRRNTNIKNRSLNSKYDKVRNNLKRGGKKSYSEEKMFGSISSGSSKTSLATEVNLIKRKVIHTTSGSKNN